MSLEQNHDLRDSFASALKMTASFHPLVLSLACKKITPGHPRPGPARQPPLPTSWAGISGDTCLSPSPGPPTLTASSPHTPTPVGRSPLQAGRGRLLPVRQLRGKGRKREGAQTCQTPPSLSDKEGQACSWSPPSGGLAMESKHSRPQGQGTKAWQSSVRFCVGDECRALRQGRLGPEEQDEGERPLELPRLNVRTGS